MAHGRSSPAVGSTIASAWGRRDASASTLDFYERHAAAYQRATVDADMRAYYRPFLHALPRGARILDAGCGSGRDTAAFAARGYEVTAIDASPAMVRLASAYSGKKCLLLPFQRLRFRSAYDGVWACASLVHTAKRDVPDVMRRFARALVPGGMLYVSLRHGRGERLERDGRFFNYYSRESFRAVLAELPELCELALWTSDTTRPDREERWLNILCRRTTARGRRRR